MIIVQLTGKPSAGKTTIANGAAERLANEGIPVEVLDGDVLRDSPINSGLGFSDEDRITNLNRIFYIAELLAKHNIVVIMAAINPFEAQRKKFASSGSHVKTVWIKCGWDVLLQRDTKGLYKRALLAEGSGNKLHHFTGIDSRYEEPANPHLVIETDTLTIGESVDRLTLFILQQLGHDAL